MHVAPWIISVSPTYQVPCMHFTDTHTASWRLAADGGANRLLDVLLLDERQNQPQQDRDEREGGGQRKRKRPRRQDDGQDGQGDDDDHTWHFQMVIYPPLPRPFLSSLLAKRTGVVVVRRRCLGACMHQHDDHGHNRPLTFTLTQ